MNTIPEETHKFTFIVEGDPQGLGHSLILPLHTDINQFLHAAVDERRFFELPAGPFLVYRIDHDGDIPSGYRIPDDLSVLQGMRELREIYPNGIPRGVVHFCLRPIRVPGVLPSVTPYTPHNETWDLLRLIKERGTPSAAADGKRFAKEQISDERPIYNGRPHTRSGPRLQPFNKAFQVFSANLQSPLSPPNAEMRRLATKLMIESSAFYDKESERLVAFRKSLAEILETGVPYEVNVSTRATPDMVISTTKGIEVVGEGKNNLGDGVDVTFQAIMSYVHAWGSPHALDETRSLTDVCCCPSFIICLAGSWFSIAAAAVIEGHVIYDKLTDFVELSDPYNDDAVDRIANILSSLRLGFQTLQSWYDSPDKEFEKPRKNFPFIRDFVDETDSKKYDLQFSSSLTIESHRLVFRAVAKSKDLKDSKEVVVKFVYRYSAQAHRLLATAGYAPKLLYDGTKTSEPQFGPLKMVIMEYLHNDENLWNREVTIATVEKAVKILHDNGMVFGDLRLSNILTMDEGVKLIDFDWAGKEGETMWSSILNPDLWWPANVQKEGGYILKVHDVDMLGHLC